jgi:hypothetical protein
VLHAVFVGSPDGAAVDEAIKAPMIAMATTAGALSWAWAGSYIVPFHHRRIAFLLFSGVVILLTLIVVLGLSAGDPNPNSNAVAAGNGIAAGLVVATAGLIFLAWPDWVALVFRRSRRRGGVLDPMAAPVAVEPHTPDNNVSAYFGAGDEASRIFKVGGLKPRLFSLRNWSTLFGDFPYAARLILAEKEILLFAVLQWFVVAAAYVLWTIVLDWIPDEMWAATRQAIEEDKDGPAGLIDLFLLFWSLLIIAAASYPISLLNAAIAAAHYLRHSGQPSTIVSCLTLASHNLGRLWLFTAIDAWTTCWAILDRLPKKRSRRTLADEAAYYAWKIGTAGIVPALVAGKNYRDAVKDSLSLVVTAPGRTIGIRMAYSLLCWLIGIGTYVGSFAYLASNAAPRGAENAVYNFYVLAAVPIILAVGATVVVLRPVYLVLICKLYTDVIQPKQRVDALQRATGPAALLPILAVLLCVVFGAYFFGDQLGVRDWVASLSERDLSRYAP